MRVTIFADVSYTIISSFFCNFIYVKKIFDSMNLKELI